MVVVGADACCAAAAVERRLMAKRQEIFTAQLLLK
jgi:hypothetical protein